MELQRGVCSLCSENTRVLTPSAVENYSKFLPEILYENFLTETEFQKIKKLLKICIICCYKIQAATETKNLFHSNKENEEVDRTDVCHFCKTDRSVIKIEKNWQNFVDRTEGYLTRYDFPVCMCPRCVFYFEVIYNMKSKLIYRFPQLAQPQPKKRHDTPNKQSDTPKRKSLSKSPPSSKKRKIFDNCFAYLQPLCNNNYHVDPELKRDKRLYRKIAYVNLKNSKDVSVKETPKMRPIIKIKLKPRKESYVYVKLSKSEEPPNKSGHKKDKDRRHSYEPRESAEENVDETPKAASTDLVPKRRVSLYMDNNDKQEFEEEPKDDEITKIVEKYISEESEDDKSKEDQKEVEAIDENGVRGEGEGEEGEKEAPQTEELTNGENTEDVPESNVSEEAKAVEDSSSSDFSVEEAAESEKWKTGSEASDSEGSDKNRVKGNETDSLNGSERKKKRVTFSDEIV